MENNQILWKLVSSHHHSHITIIYNHVIDHHHEILQTSVLVWLLIISVTICLRTAFLHIGCKERPVTMLRTAYLLASCSILSHFLREDISLFSKFAINVTAYIRVCLPNYLRNYHNDLYKKTSLRNWVLWTLNITEFIHSIAFLSTLSILVPIFLTETEYHTGMLICFHRLAGPPYSSTKHYDFSIAL